MISNTILATLVAISTAFMWFAGETRFDAYISIYTLEYLIIKAILRPKKIARDFIAIVLTAAFIFFVAKRVAEVLWV